MAVIRWKQILCLVALVVLAGCARQETGPVSPEQTSFPMTQDYVLSLQAGNQTALLSGTLEDGTTIAGKEVRLSAPPVIVDDVFFIPLQDVVETIGGACVIQGETAQVELFGTDILYTIGSHTIIVEGTAYPAEKERDAFLPYYKPIPGETAVPRWIDGVFYAASGFYAGDAPGSWWLKRADNDPEHNLVILNYQLWDEITVDGITVREDFTYWDLPQSTRESFRKTDVLEDQRYDMAVYEGKGMTLYVMDGETEDYLDGNICAIQVTEPGILSPRGLQVGDTEARAGMLYGAAEAPINTAFHIDIAICDGAVISYTIYNRFWFPTFGE